MKRIALALVWTAALALAHCGHSPAVSRPLGDSVGNAQPTPVYDPVPYVGSFANDPVQVYLSVSGMQAKLVWLGQDVPLHLTAALACAGCVGEYGDGTTVADSNVDVTLIRTATERTAVIHKLSLLPTTPPRGDSVGNASDAWFVGDWGGRGIDLKLGAASGSYELDCAHGTIDGPFGASSDGFYTATGTFVLEHGGPIRVGEQPEMHPTRYTWSLGRNHQMTLTMQWTDRQADPMTFTLDPGQGFVMKCL